MYVDSSEWGDFADDHADGDNIVWRCIFAPICNMAGPHDFYGVDDDVHPVYGGIYEASITYDVDYQEFLTGQVLLGPNNLETWSYNLWEVWERREVE